MATMIFRSLSLLSQNEKAAISINFERRTTIIQGGNGVGKSALIKSLYDTLGATPQKIDSDWKQANVASLLKFELDGELYSAFKYAGIYNFFNSKLERVLQTSSVSNELAPFLADLLQFKLLMTDRKDKIVIPPPAYAFAPFYIDQDESWNSAWACFTGMYLPGSKKVLAEYHTALKPNKYYEAKASRDQVKARIRFEENKRIGLASALTEIRSLKEETGLYFNIDDFKRETDILLEESRTLLEMQSMHREELAHIYERKSLWDTQVAITKLALAETDTAFRTSIDLPSTVECPTCGEGYDNDIRSRFNIAAESASLLSALKGAERASLEVQNEIRLTELKLDGIETAIEKISSILSYKHNELSLGEVIDIQGRNSAARTLRFQVDKLDLEIISLNEDRAGFEKKMRDTQNRERTEAIKVFFDAKLVSNATLLDTKVGDKKERRITNAVSARGSKGPRGLVAYYYAILETTKKYGSSAFCPIVIDAPNQQGQDAKHLPEIIEFLVNRRPPETQLILAVEDAQGIVSSEENDVTVIDLKSEKDQLLSKSQYENVEAEMKLYFSGML